MTWVRYDDQFPIHRKVAGLTDVLYRLHTEAISWCARNTTDGVIRAGELRQVSKRGTPERAAQLATAGLWHTAATLCRECKHALADAGTPEPADGWVLHDYLNFQPSRAKVIKEKEAKAERQARWVAAKKTTRRDTRPSRDASHPQARDASEDAAPRDANPGPPRPEGSGAEPRASGRRTAARGGNGGRNPENPDWRTLPAAGAPRDPVDADRARRGAAAARAQLRRPREQQP